MTSWREATPGPVQDDLDSLVGMGIDAARHMLQRNGEFFPFGVTLTSDGEQRLAAASSELGERPASVAVLDVLYAGVLGNREGLRAVAFVADVRADGLDAIRVQAEHRDGGPGIEVLIRYQKRRFRKAVEFGAVSAGLGPRRVWSQD
jgi:hypothetical protein